MRFEANFPGGNGKLLSATERDWGWEVEFIAESKANEPQPLWFHFQLLDLTGEKVRLRLANSAQCLGGLREWSENRPVFRLEGGEWARVEHVENGWTDGHCLETWFEVPLSGERMEFAFCYPYTEARLLKTARACPAFHMETIGFSNRGRPIRRLFNTLGNTGRSRPGIYVIARQHSGETTGTWEIDGMLRYLSGPEGAEALHAFAWWFVPLTDIDGVEEGFYGKDQVYNDLNRAWHPGFPRRVEVCAIQRDMDRWRECSTARLMLDMHGPGHGERESYFVIGADMPDAFREELRAIWQRLNVHLDALGMQRTIFREKAPGSNTSAQTGLTSAQYVHSRGVNGATFECTYQGERDGRSYTIEAYQHMGACMVKAIADTMRP